ncbi:MAG: hypothetical protein R2778_00590 [Saprospiraceae bacterium]
MSDQTVATTFMTWVIAPWAILSEEAKALLIKDKDKFLQGSQNTLSPRGSHQCHDGQWQFASGITETHS